MRIIHRALTTESDKVSLGTMIRNKDQRAARSYAKMMTREIVNDPGLKAGACGGSTKGSVDKEA